MPDFLYYRDSTIPWPSRPRCKTSRNRDYADLREPQPEDDPNSGRFAVVLSAAADSLLRDVLAADEDDALELVYQRVDALLRADAFNEVDALLAAVSVETLPAIVTLAFVSITSAARTVLSGRAAFVARVRRHLTMADPAHVEELLAGLE